MIRIANFDPGRRNLGQYVEDCSIRQLEDLSKKYHLLPKVQQRRVKGKMNKSISKILEEMYLGGETVTLGTYDICSDIPSINKKGEKKRDPEYDEQTRRNLIAHLEKFRHVWDCTDIIVIEQQYFNTYIPGKRKPFAMKQRGGEANVKAIKVAEGIYMWFLMNYPTKKIEIFPAQFKTQILGAPQSLTKPQRKKWSVEKSIDIFEKRGEDYCYRRMKFGKKLFGKKSDDSSDPCIQCQAFKFRNFIAKF